MAASACGSSLDLLNSAHDLSAKVTLAAAPAAAEDKHHQLFVVEFKSDSAQLKWEMTLRFDRFRQLATIVKATQPTPTLPGCPAFPEHHHTSTATRARWLGGLLLDKEKAQEERRKNLQLWLNHLLTHVSDLTPAVKGDLADLMHPTKQKQQQLQDGQRRGGGGVGGGGGGSSYGYAAAAEEAVSNKRASVASSSVGAVAATNSSAAGKSDALTDLILAAKRHFSERVLPDHSRLATSVTAVSRTGQLVGTTATVTTITGDVCLALWAQLGDLLFFLAVVALVSSLLCSSPPPPSTPGWETCAGVYTRRSWALKLLFASGATFVLIKWRRRFRRVYEAAAAAAGGGDSSQQLQERLRQFCNDASVAYSIELSPSASRRRLGSGSVYSDEGLSPRKASKSRSASVVARDLSAASFDKFDGFDDVSEEAKKHYWDTGNSHHFQLRGLTYLEDNNKEHPGHALCKLMLMELYEVEPHVDGDRHDHVCSKGLAKKRIEALTSLPGKPFIFVINFQIPGDPPVSMVAYFALPPNVLDRFPGPATEKFLKLFHRFANVGTEEERLAAWRAEGWAGGGGSGGGAGGGGGGGGAGAAGGAGGAAAAAAADGPGPGEGRTGSGWFKPPSDIQWPSPQEPGAYPQSDFRNQRFKLIASITDGPWVVKAAVPAKPALLGKKVVTRYFGGEGYVEVCVHVGSSLIAAQITSLCRGFVKQFGADLAIVIQGEDENELPERVIGCLHIHKIDLSLRRKLYDDDDDDDDDDENVAAAAAAEND